MRGLPATHIHGGPVRLHEMLGGPHTTFVGQLGVVTNGPDAHTSLRHAVTIKSVRSASDAVNSVCIRAPLPQPISVQLFDVQWNCASSAAKPSVSKAKE